jgi:uncharacterized protein (DUF1330 family)
MSDSNGLVDDPQVIEALRNRDLDQPIGVLNQLKFRERAVYAPDRKEEPCSGREAYGRYGLLVSQILAPLGVQTILRGALWMEGESSEWDLTFVARYPKGSIFLHLIEDPKYHGIVHHRAAALANSRLLLMDLV